MALIQSAKRELVIQEICTRIHLIFQAPNNEIGFSIIGDDDADQFFYVHPDNGDITLLQSVFESEKKQYRVSVQLGATFKTLIQWVNQQGRRFVDKLILE